MRMWGVNVTRMCSKHLLGEHVEMHMFVGCLKKEKSIQGYIDKGLVEVSNISKRHEEIVEEMKKRNMNHKSEIEDTTQGWFIPYKDNGKVDVAKNELELKNRCKECKF